MRENTETKQRLADYRLERAVWSDANLGKEPRESLSVDNLGGKCILPAPEKVAATSAKPVDLSPAYGDTGKLVCKAREPDAPEKDDEDLHGLASLCGNSLSVFH